MIDPAAPNPDVLQFLTERHLATLSVQRPSGMPHVSAVGFTYDPETQTARVITWADSWKAKHVLAGPEQIGALCQVDGGRWLALYGPVTVAADDDATAEGVRRYAERYRQPKERDDRVVIEMQVQQILGRA